MEPERVRTVRNASFQRHGLGGGVKASVRQTEITGKLPDEIICCDLFLSCIGFNANLPHKQKQQQTVRGSAVHAERPAVRTRGGDTVWVGSLLQSSLWPAAPPPPYFSMLLCSTAVA